MQLSKESSARKISRTELEIKLNAAHKTYVLIQVNLANAPQKDDLFSCFLDDWVESINLVILTIQQKK